MGSTIILVIEDDRSIQRLIELSLKAEGYKTVCASAGAVGVSLAKSDNPDLILLDLGLPDCDGVDLISDLCDLDCGPIIVVTARDQENMKVRALDAGASDYVVKPFGTAELLARIRVALRSRKPAAASDTVFDAGGLHVDFERREVSVDGVPMHLTPNEFSLLEVFIRNRGKALTHRFIHHEIWGYPTEDNYRTLRVLTATLRKKLGDSPSAPRFIQTEVGIGYRFIL